MTSCLKKIDLAMVWKMAAHFILWRAGANDADGWFCAPYTADLPTCTLDLSSVALPQVVIKILLFILPLPARFGTLQVAVAPVDIDDGRRFLYLPLY